MKSQETSNGGGVHRVKKIYCMLRALQRPFREPVNLPRGGDALIHAVALPSINCVVPSNEVCLGVYKVS